MLWAAVAASPLITAQRYSTWSNIFVVINEQVDFDQAGVDVGKWVEFLSFPHIAGIEESVNGMHLVRSLFTKKGVVRGFSVTLPLISFAVPDIATFSASIRPTIRITSPPSSPPPPGPLPPLPSRNAQAQPLLPAPPPPARESDTTSPPLPSPQSPHLRRNGTSAGVRHPVLVVCIIAATTVSLMTAATVITYLRWRPTASLTNQVRPSTATLRL